MKGHPSRWNHGRKNIEAGRNSSPGGVVVGWEEDWNLRMEGQIRAVECHEKEYSGQWKAMKRLIGPGVFFFLNHVSFRCACVHAESLQSCLILCDPMDCILPGSCVHGIPGKNTGMGCHGLLKGNLPDRGIKPASLTSSA